MILQTSWLAHLREINTTDQANKNFGAFVDATAVEPHKSHNWIYKIYNVSQRNVMLPVQLKYYV
jgi:hypothetical protein